LIEELIAKLTELTDFRKARYRWLMMQGAPDSGQTTLTGHLVRQPEVQAYFRHSILWLTAAGATPRVWGSQLKYGWQGFLTRLAPEQRTDRDLGVAALPPDFLNLSPEDIFWYWLGRTETVALLIMDSDLPPKLMGQLLQRAGAQIRFLVLPPALPGLKEMALRYVSENETEGIEIPPLTGREAYTLAQTIAPEIMTEAEASWFTPVLEQVNTPAALQLVASEARQLGWATINRWLWHDRLPSVLRSQVSNIWQEFWPQLTVDEQNQLTILAYISDHPGTFGTKYAAIAGQLDEKTAGEQLKYLYQRGWLEQVDEQNRGVPVRLQALLGEPRYRLPRPAWEFIRSQPRPWTDYKLANRRLQWAGQLTQQLQQLYAMPWYLTPWVSLRLAWAWLNGTPDLYGALALFWQERGYKPPGEIEALSGNKSQITFVISAYLILMGIASAIMVAVGKYNLLGESASEGNSIMLFSVIIVGLLLAGFALIPIGLRALIWQSQLLVEYQGDQVDPRLAWLKPYVTSPPPGEADVVEEQES
jgi:hypothetical protein